MSAWSIIAGNKQTAVLQRNIPTADTSGANVAAWLTIFPAIAVFEQERSGGESPEYGREVNRKRSVWYAESGYDIRTGDRLVIGTRTLDIVNVADRRYGTRKYLAHIRMDCEEVL